MVTSFLISTGLISIFLGLSGVGAIDANYHKLSKSQLAIYIGNVLTVGAVTFLFLAGLTSLFGSRLTDAAGLPLEMLLLCITVAYAQFITNINLTIWVLEKDPRRYGMYQLSQTLLFLCLSYLLVAILNVGWLGHIVSVVISTLLFSFLSLSTLYRRGYLKLKIEPDHIRDYLRFGVPMVPHQLSKWLRAQGDKFLVLTLLGASSGGLFALGQQLSAAMHVLYTAANKAIYPVLFERLSTDLDEKDQKNLVNVTYMLSAIIIIAMLGFQLIMSYVYDYLVGPQFHEAILVTRICAIAVMFDGLYLLFVNYYFFFKETQFLAKLTVTISIIHVAFITMAITIFEQGFVMVATVGVLSSAVQFIAVAVETRRLIRLPWFKF